jgi:hypothetical protein
MADAFSSPSLYTRVDPPGLMAWLYRREKVLEEITRWNPDVVTLQVSFPSPSFFPSLRASPSAAPPARGSSQHPPSLPPSLPLSLPPSLLLRKSTTTSTTSFPPSPPLAIPVPLCGNR